MNCNGQIIIFWDKEGEDAVFKWPFPGRHSQNETKLGKRFALTSGQGWFPGHPPEVLTGECGEKSSRAARVTHPTSSVFHHSREKPKPSKQNKTRTVKSTGEEGSPTREPPVCGICLAKAFYKWWRGQGAAVTLGHLSSRSLGFGGGVGASWSSVCARGLEWDDL